MGALKWMRVKLVPQKGKERGVVINMQINRSKYCPRKKLNELLEEVWEIKKEHPDIKMNIEVMG